MADIVLIQPPFEDFYCTAVRTQPLGLLHVGAALIRDGFSVALTDALEEGKRRRVPLPSAFGYMREHTPGDRAPFALFSGYYRYGLEEEEILERVNKERPRMIGVSLLTTAYSDSGLELARRLRERFPGAVLFCGGHHATRFPEACLQIFDFVVRGDGETAAIGLARSLLRGRGTVDDIPGVCRREGGTGVQRIREPVFLSADELHRLRPARNLTRIPQVRGRRFTQILTSRGCPLSCTYCCTARSLSGGYRQRKVEDVTAEFEACLREGITHFDIEDENVTFDRERARALFRDLARTIQGKDVILTAMNGLLPETLDTGLLDLMREAGFERLDLSLGSTSPAILQRYGRPPGLMEPFERAVQCARRRGMEVTAYVISGGPHAGPDDITRDLLQLAGLPVRVGLSTYYPAPGSRDYEAGLFRKPASFGLHRASVYPVEGRMNRLAMVTASRIARLLNYLKSLPSQGIRSLRDVEPAEADEVIRPGEEVRLAASFLCHGTLMGLSPQGRRAYPHRRDPGLSETVRQGLIRAGSVAGPRDDLEIWPPTPDGPAGRLPPGG